MKVNKEGRKRSEGDGGVKRRGIKKSEEEKKRKKKWQRTKEQPREEGTNGQRVKEGLPVIVCAATVSDWPCEGEEARR